MHGQDGWGVGYGHFVAARWDADLAVGPRPRGDGHSDVASAGVVGLDGGQLDHEVALVLEAIGEYGGDQVGDLRLRVDDGFGFALGADRCVTRMAEEVRHRFDDFADGCAGVHRPVVRRGPDTAG